MHSFTIVELYILSNTVHVLTVSLSYRTMAVFIYADANVLMANSRRGRVCTFVGQSHAGIPGMALSWHSSSAPMTGAYSTPLTPISLLVSAVTNPKSLPAFPWRLALAEQMASVC